MQSVDPVISHPISVKAPESFTNVQVHMFENHLQQIQIMKKADSRVEGRLRDLPIAWNSQFISAACVARWCFVIQGVGRRLRFPGKIKSVTVS